MSQKEGHLQDYRRKRMFDRTSEPRGNEVSEKRRDPVFVVQKHAARRLHYDFRLEIGGVLKSWAVPKGPSMDPGQKRLAVMVEDHPLDYAQFEGHIPDELYGGGDVIVWDRGTYQNLKSTQDAAAATMETALAAGELMFSLAGEKLRGAFVLIQTRMGGDERNWLLIKKKDDHALREGDILTERPESVMTGRTL